MEALILVLLLIGLVVWIASKTSSKKKTSTRREEREEPEPTIHRVGIKITVSGPDWSSGGWEGNRKFAASPETVWVPSGRTVDVAGFSIPGGMLYVGEGLGAVQSAYRAEPALINPALAVNRRVADPTLRALSYWPSYTEATPAARAAYLSWLADGRRAPSADTGYVFLYFYGLERRVLSDAQQSATAAAEVPAILQEVERLLGIYGSNHSFVGYAESFLRYCRATKGLLGRRYESPPPSQRAGFELPFDLTLGLGQMVAEGKPIPPEWAFAWMALHPETYLRTPAQRCPEEFKTLFSARYREKFGEGLVIKTNKTVLAVEHRAASASLGGETYRKGLDVPDIRAISGPINRLREIGLACCDELDSFSRYLGRNPDAKGSISAVALLPDVLISTSSGKEEDEIRALVNQAIGGEGYGFLRANDLLRCWPLKNPGKMAKNEAVQLIQLLERWGFGVEPDVRFGGRPPADGDVLVSFRLPSERLHSPSREYSAAMLILHLAAMVSAADGRISPDEERHLGEYLESGLRLPHPEKVRLRAHLRWLFEAKPGYSGVKKRLEGFSENQRAEVGNFLVSVACADGCADPTEVKTLTKLFDAIGLDTGALHGQIHAALSGGRAGGEPVTIRVATLQESGYAIPIEVKQPQQPTVSLDMDCVHQKLAETAAVSALLGGIFAEEEPATASAVLPEAGTVAGLDTAHSSLVRALAEKTSWAREELDAIVSSIGLLLDGALEVVNEAAYELLHQPLCEGEDPVEVDHEVLRGMLT